MASAKKIDKKIDKKTNKKKTETKKVESKKAGSKKVESKKVRSKKAETENKVASPKAVSHKADRKKSHSPNGLAKKTAPQKQRNVSIAVPAAAAAKPSAVSGMHAEPVSASWTVAALRDRARSEGVVGYSRLAKADLVALLTAK